MSVNVSNRSNVVNQTKYNADLKFGLRSEGEVQQRLIDHFKQDVKKFKNYYSVFDYYITNQNGKISDIIEVKSRRNDSKKYDTQLIGMNKVNKGKKELKKGVKVWFVFNLTDGLYKLELNEEHQFKEVMCGNFARNDKASKLALIPNEYLSKIELIDKGTIVF
tara:strand:+ start:10236 stop:10724 length:489 start_codon:yes stop_codon:yes gene_type:complete